MRYTHGNLKCHELIGLEVEVLDHSNRSLIGVSGRVVWETKNMLVIKSSNYEIAVSKQYGVFSFKVPNTGIVVRVVGEEILERPEDRVRMCG